MITKMIADKLVETHETFYRKDLEINGAKVFIYNYLIADKVALADKYAKELRGLTITHEGGHERVFLSCPKFYNINEVPENEEKILQNKKIKKVTDKMDGSLIQFIEINGEVLAKSKQSFENDQSKMAQEILDESTELKFFILDCWSNNYHPLFELVGPDNQIVVDYPKNEIYLIGVRNDDGHFIDLEKFYYKYSAACYNLTLDEMIHQAKTAKDIEGFVVKFTDESIVKIKTIDYLEKHRLVSDGDSYKTILKRILEENIDDVLQVIPEAKRARIRNLEKYLDEYVVHYTQQIHDIIKKQSTKSRKEIVEEVRTHRFFSVIMKNLEGDISDIKDSLIDLLLKKYSREKKAKEFFNFLIPHN